MYRGPNRGPNKAYVVLKATILIAVLCSNPSCPRALLTRVSFVLVDSTGIIQTVSFVLIDSIGII
jgi:hypothetical protein